MFLALQRLDRRLALAVAASDAGQGTPAEFDEFRGLYLTGEDVARSLDRRPGEPAWSPPGDGTEPARASDGGTTPAGAESDNAWLEPVVRAAAPGVELSALDAELVLI